MSKPQCGLRLTDSSESASRPLPLDKPILSRDSNLDCKLASGEWCLVRRSNESEAKTEPPAATSKEVTRTGVSVLRGLGRVGKVAPMRTQVVVALSGVSAANTAVSTVTALTPTGSTEWSSFSSLWDEFYVHGCHVKWCDSGVGTAGIVGTNLAVRAYDPGQTTALSTVADGCVYKQHALTVAGADSATVSSSAVGATSDGLFSWKISIPRGTVLDSATATNVVGSWSLTSSTDSCGYLKRYIPALGAGVSYQYQEILYFDVSFRTRQ